MHYKLGISEKTWTYIGVASAALLLTTTGKNALNVVGKGGVFGYGKSKRLASLGRNREATWGNLQNLSLVLIALTMLESNYDAFERMKTARANEDYSKLLF